VLVDWVDEQQECWLGRKAADTRRLSADRTAELIRMSEHSRAWRSRVPRSHLTDAFS
jgi:hypothetical protein